MTDDNKNKEVDSETGVETTGHEWDGIKELNNPAPLWWLWVFYACVIWSIGYWVVFPAWPTLENATKGMWGWSQYSRLAERQAEISARQGVMADRVRAASLEDIIESPELFTFAKRGGAIAFKNHCAACHGTGAAGGPGYPNLNDDDWIWGGTLDDIYTTIQYGIRNEHEDSRVSMMPAYGESGLLTREEIFDVADYVLSLSGKGAANANGARVFGEQCAACHGDDGKGMTMLGSPNLTDAIWLYGGKKEDIIYTVTHSRNGVMPPWTDKLDDATIKQLAVYVHSLGGGE